MTPAEPDVPSNQRNAWWKMQGVFFEPSQTFQEIDRQPNWLFPFLAILLILAITSQITIQTIGLETIIRNGITGRPQGQNLSEEQLDATVDRITSSTAWRASIYLQALIVPLFLVLFSSLVLMGALYLVGSETSFVKVFSVCAHTFFVYYLLYSTLSCSVIVLAPDPGAIDLTNPLYSNLGFAVNREESPALYHVASSLDLISVYQLYLLSLGLWTVSRKTSLRTVAAAVILLWVLWIAAKAGFAVVF